MVENQTEFIAADSRDHVASTQARLQDSRHMQQNRISRLMAVAIIYRLKAIEVDEQHSGRRLVSGRLMQDTFKLPEKGTPIGQWQQCVRIRQSLQLFEPRAQIGKGCLQSFIFICEAANNAAVKILQHLVPQNATQ